MSLTLIFVCYAVLLAAVIPASLELRAELAVSKYLQLKINKFLLPKWALVAMWCWPLVLALATYTYFHYAWGYAAGMVLVYFGAPAFIPIPKSTIEGVFRKLGAYCKKYPKVRNDIENAAIHGHVYGHLKKYL